MSILPQVRSQEARAQSALGTNRSGWWSHAWHCEALAGSTRQLELHQQGQHQGFSLGSALLALPAFLGREPQSLQGYICCSPLPRPLPFSPLAMKCELNPKILAENSWPKGLTLSRSSPAWDQGLCSHPSPQILGGGEREASDCLPKDKETGIQSQTPLTNLPTTLQSSPWR